MPEQAMRLVGAECRVGHFTRRIGTSATTDAAHPSCAMSIAGGSSGRPCGRAFRAGQALVYWLDRTIPLKYGRDRLRILGMEQGLRAHRFQERDSRRDQPQDADFDTLDGGARSLDDQCGACIRRDRAEPRRSAQRRNTGATSALGKPVVARRPTFRSEILNGSAADFAKLMQTGVEAGG